MIAGRHELLKEQIIRLLVLNFFISSLICSVRIAGDETIADDTTLLESTSDPNSSASVFASAADAVSASIPSSMSAPMAEGMSTCHAERIMSNSMASTSSQADNLSGVQWTQRGAGVVQTPCIVCCDPIQYVIARWQNLMANVTEYACHNSWAVCNKHCSCGSWYYCLWMRLMLLYIKQAYTDVLVRLLDLQ